MAPFCRGVSHTVDVLALFCSSPCNIIEPFVTVGLSATVNFALLPSQIASLPNAATLPGSVVVLTPEKSL